MKQIFKLLAFLSITSLHADSPLPWEKTKLIWGGGMEAVCDVGCDSDPCRFFQNPLHFDPEEYMNIKAGDIVWVSPRYIKRFYIEVLPSVTQPFVLLINDARDGDNSFPSNCFMTDSIEALLSNPNIIHIFAQNCDYTGSSEKVSHFPIGIDYHSAAYKGAKKIWGIREMPHHQEKILRNIANISKPTRHRKKKAFVDFHHNDSMRLTFRRDLQFGEDRTSIFKRLDNTGLIDHAKFIDRYALWRKKSEYAFSISPPGNGLDCHRTWEDLVLGCIVIVKTSPLDPLYEGLPVVIVQDWSEVTKENLDHWLSIFGDVLHNEEYRTKLTHDYWYGKMLEKAAPYRKPID